MKPESSGNSLIDFITQRVVGGLIPFRDADEFSEEQYEGLKRRNNWIDIAATVLSCFAFAPPVILPIALRGAPVNFTGWDLCLILSSSVAVPTIFVVALTPRLGKGRFSEFLTFYSLKYGFDAYKMFLYVYMPIVVLAGVSACIAYG